MKKEFSFIIIPPSSKRPWEKRVSLKTIRILTIIAGLIIAGLIALIYNSFRVHYELAEYYYLKKENQRLKERVNKLIEIERRIGYIDKESKKIKKMLGMDKSPPPVDFTKAVFAYEPPKPESVIEDSTQESFKLRVLPTIGFIVTRGFSQAHPGIDLATEEGSPAFACTRGIVEKIGSDPIYGNFLIIKHTKDYKTFYGHLIKIVKAKGDSVKPGDIIGFIGTIGRTSGPHLHFGVIYKGKEIDPKEFFHNLR